LDADLFAGIATRLAGEQPKSLVLRAAHVVVHFLGKRLPLLLLFSFRLFKTNSFADSEPGSLFLQCAWAVVLDNPRSKPIY
jgi:hypothetical protein